MIDMLSSTAAGSSRAASSRPVSGAPRHRASFLAFAPLLVIAGLCFFGMGQQLITSHRNADSGIIPLTEVDRIARGVCLQITGGPSVLRDASMQTAYSKRRGTIIREWNILCDTDQGEYLLRINAASGRVYAINRVSEEAPHTANISANNVPDDLEDGEASPLTRSEAEHQARHYLALMSIPTRGLSTVVEAMPDQNKSVQEWNFTFRRNVPGMGQRLLKVSVSGKNGSLEDAWNPVYAL